MNSLDFHRVPSLWGTWVFESSQINLMMCTWYNEIIHIKIYNLRNPETTISSTLRTGYKQTNKQPYHIISHLHESKKPNPNRWNHKSRIKKAYTNIYTSILPPTSLPQFHKYNQHNVTYHHLGNIPIPHREFYRSHLGYDMLPDARKPRKCGFSACGEVLGSESIANHEMLWGCFVLFCFVVVRFEIDG